MQLQCYFSGGLGASEKGPPEAIQLPHRQHVMRLGCGERVCQSHGQEIQVGAKAKDGIKNGPLRAYQAIGDLAGRATQTVGIGFGRRLA